MIELLASLPQERGTSVILVTHEPRYAAYADRVVSMRDGRIIGVSGPLGEDRELEEAR